MTAAAATANAPSGVEVSVARWPVLEIRVRTPLTIQDIDAAYDIIDQWARRGERHAHWTDLRAIHPLSLPANLRKRFAEREKALYSSAQHLIVADVRIVDRPVVRGLLRAFEWLVGETPWPVRNVATEAEADAWLRELGVLPQK